MSTHHRIAITLVTLLLGASARSTAQEDARKLFESGKYPAVVERTAEDDSPGAQYLKGLAHLRLKQPDEAKDAFRRLERGDEAWKAVGESAVALVDGNRDGALEAARAAVERNAGLAEAQYQLGVVLEAGASDRPRPTRSSKPPKPIHRWPTRTFTPR